MKAKRKTVLIIISVLLVLLITVAVYFFQFDHTGYAMTIPVRNSFTQIGENVYINNNNAKSPEEILALIKQAEERVGAFYGDLHYKDETVIIVCDDTGLKEKLGGGKSTFTMTIPSKKHYICLSDDYFNLDIVSHEITHAELHTRLSVSALNSIPSWFDEGIATQNDYREQYSEENWIARTDNGKNAIALEDMDEPSEFYAGEADDRRFRYINAKHEVAQWMEEHKTEGLLALIDRINNGEDFQAVYGK